MRPKPARVAVDISKQKFNSDEEKKRALFPGLAIPNKPVAHDEPEKENDALSALEALAPSKQRFVIIFHRVLF